MSKMAFSMINFLKEDVRLVKYENQIYKLKILFEDEQKLANFVIKFSQKEAHYELEQVIRGVLCAIEKKQILNKIQTDKFVVNVKTKTWGTSQKLGFKQNGVHVPSYPFMIILNVTVKDLEEEDISNDDEILVQNQTTELNSNKNVKNTSNDVNSNIRVSQKKFPTKESNAKTTNKAPHHQKPKEKILTTNVVVDNNTEDGLSTQDICDLLEEARQLSEVEKMEAKQQERKEKRAKEDLEQFAAKYAQKVVKEKEKKKICNVPGNFVSSPRKVTQNTSRNPNNQRKMSDSPSISKPSSKNNESPRKSRKDQRQVTSPDKITQQSDFESSTDLMGVISKLRNRKRKLSESSQLQSPQSESFPEKRRSGRRSKLQLSPPSTGTLKSKKQKEAVKKKCLENQDSKKKSSLMSRKTDESSEESENKRLQLHLSNKIRKSPRIQKKVSEEKLPNKNNSARNSGVNLHELRSTRRDRHLIEQDELAEDMKLQKLAKSSPKLKHKTSSRLKRRSSTLWDYIVSPVKSIFTK